MFYDSERLLVVVVCGDVILPFKAVNAKSRLGGQDALAEPLRH